MTLETYEHTFDSKNWSFCPRFVLSPRPVSACLRVVSVPPLLALLPLLVVICLLLVVAWVFLQVVFNTT